MRLLHSFCSATTAEEKKIMIFMRNSESDSSQAFIAVCNGMNQKAKQFVLSKVIWLANLFGEYSSNLDD